MTTALEGVRVERHAPAALYPGKDPLPIVQEAVYAPDPVCRGEENFALPEFDHRTVQSVAQSLYLLRYPAHFSKVLLTKIHTDQRTRIYIFQFIYMNK
jgi:hypothetical protein